MGTYATPADLAASLHVTVGPKTSALLGACVDAASLQIDHTVDRMIGSELDDDNPVAHTVCLGYGVELYKLNEAVFGVTGFADTGVLAVPRDGFARYAAMLVPLIQQFGIA